MSVWHPARGTEAVEKPEGQVAGRNRVAKQCYIHPGNPAVAACSQCRRGLCNACALRRDSDGRCLDCRTRYSLAHGQRSADAGQPNVCYLHRSIPAKAQCSRCHRPLCAGCALPIRQGHFACAECAPLLVRRARRSAGPLLLLIFGAAALFLLLFLSVPAAPNTPSQKEAWTPIPVPAGAGMAVPAQTPTAPVVPIPPPSTGTGSLSLEQAAALIRGYTVLVVTNLSYGSGISLGRGYLLTAYHVVEGASRVQVRFASGREGKATVAHSDRRRDLALLQSSLANEPAAAMGDVLTLRPAESLLAVGYPRADVIGVQDATITRGILSSRWRSPAGVWYVQTDTPINPGNSGGPLADSQGRVVGVVTFRVRETVGLNYAVAGDEVLAFLKGSGTLPGSP